MWFVGKSELLSLIERNCLEEVMPAFSDHRSLRKNALIYRPEEQSEYVYLLKVGHVRLYRLTEEGQEITLSFIKAGMIFGDGDVLNEASYSHYAQTLAESRVCYIRKADFKDLLKRYDAINQFVLRSHHQRWQEAQKLIENLSLHDVRKRLVNILTMFASQIGAPFVHDGANGNHTVGAGQGFGFNAERTRLAAGNEHHVRAHALHPIGAGDLGCSVDCCGLQDDELRSDVQRRIRRGDLHREFRQAPVTVGPEPQ